MDPTKETTLINAVGGPGGVQGISATGGNINQPQGGAQAIKAIIKNADMTDEMQQDSVDIASAALEKYNIEKDIAANIKKEFDKKYGPTWHVVVGKNFGSYVTHGEQQSPSPSSHPFRLIVILQKRNTLSTFISALSQSSYGNRDGPIFSF